MLGHSTERACPTVSDVILSLQEFTSSLPAALRWLGVMLVALIPYVEAEGAAIIGVVAGVHPVAAVLFGVLGNALALAAIIWLVAAVRSRVTSGRAAAQDDHSADSPAPATTDVKRARMRRVFDRYGVPGVSLLGPLLLPSHVTAAAMVGFGASRVRVFVWGVVAVALWAALLTTLVHLGIQAAIH